MKIAFLTSEFPHHKTGNSGGIGTSIMNLSKGLLLLGHKVIVLIYGQSEDEFFQENGIEFYRIKNVKFKGISRFLTQKKIEKLINSLVKKQKIDILEAPDWTGITSYIHLKCPLVIKLNGSDTYFCHLDNRPVKWINRFHEKRALKKANALISVSKFTANLTNKLFRLNKEFTIIPNCIDIKAFQIIDNKNNNQEATILYFGTLIRKKGVLELPLIFNEVYKKNKNVKLILVGKDSSDIISGNTSTWEMIKTLFDDEAFKNVDYLGSVSYEKIKDYINSSLICVFPTFAEALPVSWIEAMAMQKAIVASNIGWANEVVDNGSNGFLVNPKEHIAYANKVLELLGSEELRTQFGTNAKIKVIQKFSIEEVAKQNIAFYQKYIEKYNKKI